MKKILTAILAILFIPVVVLAVESTVVVNPDKTMTITVTFTENEQKYLENDLLNLEDWVRMAVIGKTNKCKTRMVQEWDAKLRADKDVVSIPTDETTWLSTVTSRTDYKNRSERDAEAIK